MSGPSPSNPNQPAQSSAPAGQAVGNAAPPQQQQQQRVNGASTAAPSAPNAAPPGNLSQQNLNSIVIEYLNKKGYNRTEAMLRSESANVDQEGRPLYQRAEDKGGEKYRVAFRLIRDWVDQGVLEVYKGELKGLLWPIFVYSLLGMLTEFYEKDVEEFRYTFSELFVANYETDLRKLEKLALPEHVKGDELAQLYLNNKYRIVLSEAAYTQLISFLEAKDKEGGSVILFIISNHCNVVIGRTAAEPGSLANLLHKANLEEDMAPEEEGIPGHIPGLAKASEVGHSGQPKLKLGPIHMEPELQGDVRMELEDEDARNPPAAGQTSLVDEFSNQIKREESEEGPARTEIPFPPSLNRDVMWEVNRIKEHRDRFRLDAKTSSATPGISVCMFTFHNTYDHVNCMDFSDDNYLAAVGTDDSYIRVFALDGKALNSIVPTGVTEEAPSSSRRLIGHSAPVYAVSFSPSIAIDKEERDPTSNSVNTPSSRYLLSASSDKTVRLWSVDAWTCLVVYKGHLSPLWDIKWGPHGHYFLTGGMDKTARLWTTDQIAAVRLFVGHDNDVDVVGFHPNSAYVFTGSCDKTVRMWSVATGNAVRLFNGHTGNITAMACSNDGKTLASADDAGRIILWDLQSGRRLKRMRGHGNGGIWSLSWSAESTVLLSGGQDGTVRLWDVKAMVTPGDTQVVQGKVISEGGAGSKIDGAGKAAAQGTTTTAAGTSATGTSGTGRKKGKEKNVVTADQISAFPTKQSPVYSVKLTRTNLGVAGGCYLG